MYDKNGGLNVLHSIPHDGGETVCTVCGVDKKWITQNSGHVWTFQPVGPTVPNQTAKYPKVWCTGVHPSQLPSQLPDVPDVLLSTYPEGTTAVIHLFPAHEALCCNIKASDLGKKILGLQHLKTTDPKWTLNHPGWAKCNGWPKQEFEFVFPKAEGCKHTVHLWPTGTMISTDQQAKSLCCGGTVEQLKAHNASTPMTVDGQSGPKHLFSTHDVPKPAGSSQGWCPMKPPAPLSSTPSNNEKANCMICGWPRSVQGGLDKDGGDLYGACEGVKVYDSAHQLIKITCAHHCPECHQPECQCCQNCHTLHATNDPCAKPLESAWTTTTATFQPSGAVLKKPKKSPIFSEAVNTVEIGGEEVKVEDDDEPASSNYFPAQYGCKVCHQHITLCACPGGPTNTTYTVPVATQCMPPPWIARGQIPKRRHKDVDKAWKNLRPEECDPVEWAADFYLYHAITSGALNGQHECDAAPGPCPHQIRTMLTLEQPPVLWEARFALDEVVEQADRTFVEYVDMACGGEVRHHPNIGGKALSSQRHIAWAEWRDVRDLVGLQALLDMAALFLDYQQGEGGVCGKRWAAAALLLHRRLTGAISKETFVDQVFSLVHNGGVFLNKRTWKNNRLYALQGVVLPAQARDDFSTLLDFASPHARSLWNEAWRATNFARIRAGVKPTPFIRQRGIQVCQSCGMPSTAGHRMWECRTATINRVRDATSVDHYRRQQWVPNWSWDMKTLYLYPGREYRCPLATPHWTDAKHILGAKITVPDHKRTLVIGDGDYNFVKFPISKFKGQEWNIKDLIEIHGVKAQLTDYQTKQPLEEVDA